MTRDQFICEKVMGKCWHELKDECMNDIFPKCSCGRAFNNKRILENHCERNNPNYSTSPADILALQQFVMGAEWWRDFCSWAWSKNHDSGGDWGTSAFVKWLFSDPERFATLVAEYRGWQP
jgi:hypothetical protein